nr:hypothetical protein CFP56_11912 [Quercus suber]
MALHFTGLLDFFGDFLEELRRCELETTGGSSGFANHTSADLGGGGGSLRYGSSSSPPNRSSSLMYALGVSWLCLRMTADEKLILRDEADCGMSTHVEVVDDAEPILIDEEPSELVMGV